MKYLVKFRIFDEYTVLVDSEYEGNAENAAIMSYNHQDELKPGSPYSPVKILSIVKNVHQRISTKEYKK